MAKPRKHHDGDPSLSGTSAATLSTGDGNGSDGANPDPERISMRAYELYQARGGADGQAVEDWLAAERELTPGGDSATRGDRGE